MRIPNLSNYCALIYLHLRYILTAALKLKLNQGTEVIQQTLPFSHLIIIQNFSSHNLINNPGFFLVSIGLYLLLSSLCFVVVMLHRGSKWLKSAKNKLPKVISQIFQSKFQQIHKISVSCYFISFKIERCLIFHQKCKIWGVQIILF